MPEITYRDAVIRGIAQEMARDNDVVFLGEDVAKLTAYLARANEHYTTDRYWLWCEEYLPHLPEKVHDWVTSPDFDRLLRETVDATYPEHEREQVMGHFRGLTGLWAKDNAPA